MSIRHTTAVWTDETMPEPTVRVYHDGEHGEHTKVQVGIGMSFYLYGRTHDDVIRWLDTVREAVDADRARLTAETLRAEGVASTANSAWARSALCAALARLDQEVRHA